MNLFFELGIIFLVVAVVSIVMKLLKQPLITGYIIAGVVLGGFIAGMQSTAETFNTFSQIGIAFLLFIVGLTLKPKTLKEMGISSVALGIGQVVLTSVAGYFLLLFLGFSNVESAYLAIGFTLSSTIVVSKILSDKGDLEKLYGKISIGILLLQDVVAIIAVIIASSYRTDGETFWSAPISILQGIIAIGILFFLGAKFLPKLETFLAKSPELLFIFSIGWGLGVSILFGILGFSIEIGALVAGVALAMSPYSYEISAKMRPLRDFFLVLFFVFIGAQLSFGLSFEFFAIGLLLSLFVLIVDPLIAMIIAGALGYDKRTSFFSGLSMAQVSEFSLILVAIGVANGHVGRDALSLVTLIAVITMGVSSYLMMYAEKIYPVIGKYLPIFSFKNREKTDSENEKENGADIVLFGCNRIGFDFVDVFKSSKRKFLVVDYNPEVIKQLKKEGVFCIFGDADDPEFLNGLNMKKFKMIISTVPDIDTNTLILQKAKQENPDSIVILTAYDIENAEFLYKSGASYVIMPHFLGGTYASNMVNENAFSEEGFRYEKTKHASYLAKKVKRRHKHPGAEKFI